MCEQDAGCGHVDRRPANDKLIGASADFNPKTRLNLAQMSIQLTAQHRQMAGVIGFQGEAFLDRRRRRDFTVQNESGATRAMYENKRIYPISVSSTVAQAAAQRIGQGLMDIDINKLANQGVITAAEVNNTVVFSAPL